MSNNHEHTPYDPDLELAREYGQILDGASAHNAKKDPLFILLSESRATSQQMEEATSVDGLAESWQALSRVIHGADRNNTNLLFRMPILRYWPRLAAAIVLGLLFSILFVVRPFDSDSRIVAQAGSALTTITLNDGSRVTLRPNSTLAKDPSEENRSYSLTGDALFEVEPLQNNPFSVLAGNGRVVVTGTSFHISSRERQTSVHLLEGRVRFETADGAHSVELAPGDASSIDEEMQILEPYTFQRDEILGWTQNRLIFNNRPVTQLLKELEFQFDISLEAPGSVQSDSLGGSISLESLDVALNDLGSVLGGHFVQKTEETYHFRVGNETVP